MSENQKDGGEGEQELDEGAKFDKMFDKAFGLTDQSQPERVDDTNPVKQISNEVRVPEPESSEPQDDETEEPETLRSAKSDTPEEDAEEPETLKPAEDGRSDDDTPDIEILETGQGEVSYDVRAAISEDIAERIENYDFEAITITAPSAAFGEIFYQKILTACKNENLKIEKDKDNKTIIISKLPDIDYNERTMGKGAIDTLMGMQRPFPNSFTLL